MPTNIHCASINRVRYLIRLAMNYVFTNAKTSVVARWNFHSLCSFSIPTPCRIKQRVPVQRPRNTPLELMDSSLKKVDRSKEVKSLRFLLIEAANASGEIVRVPFPCGWGHWNPFPMQTWIGQPTQKERKEHHPAPPTHPPRVSMCSHRDIWPKKRGDLLLPEWTQTEKGHFISRCFLCPIAAAYTTSSSSSSLSLFLLCAVIVCDMVWPREKERRRRSC